MSTVTCSGPASPGTRRRGPPAAGSPGNWAITVNGELRPALTYRNAAQPD